jgi:predicted DNA-binding transcriptional regulator AlpA
LSDAKQRILTEGEVSRVLGIKQRTLQRWRALGVGPQYLRLSERSVRYQLKDIQDWILECKEVTKKKVIIRHF